MVGRVQRSMACDAPCVLRIGKCSSPIGINLARRNVYQGFWKKQEACGRASLKGDMHARMNFQNEWEKKKIAGLDSRGVLRNQKKLPDGRRSPQSFSDASDLVEFGNPLHSSNGGDVTSIVLLRNPEEYRTVTWKHLKSFAWSHCRDLDHAENSSLVYLSNNCKEMLVKKGWESHFKTHNFRCLVSRGRIRAARAKTRFYWKRVSPRLQESDVDAHSDLRNIQISRQARTILDLYQSCNSDELKVSKPWNKLRRYSMAARTSSTSFLSSEKGSMMHTTSRKSKVKKFGQERLHRAGATPQGPRRIGVGTRTPSKASNLIQVSPLVLRKSLIRFKWHFPRKSASCRELPRGALKIGPWSFYYSDKMENAATRIQAQWRMYLATNHYRCLRRVTLTMQRRWRESKRVCNPIVAALDSIEKEVRVADCLNSEIEGGSYEPGELDLGTSHESPCKNSIRNESRNYLKSARFAVKRLYEDNISALQEDEIFSELLSFLPCPESGSRENGYVNSSMICSQSQPENDHKNLDSFLNSWSFYLCGLDVPASPPVKELTFAKISTDGSLPSTPLKDWTAHKQEAGESFPAESGVKDSNFLAIFELPPSPTKDWASPLCEGVDSNFFVELSHCREFKDDRLQLPSEWFIDLDVSETPETRWDTSNMNNVSLFSPPNPSPKPQHRFIGQKMTISSCRALMRIPEEPAFNSLSPHFVKECSVKTSILGEPGFPMTPKITDPPHWSDVTFAQDDVGSFRWTSSAIARSESCGLDSFVSVPPALADELRDELSKLMPGFPDSVVGPSYKPRSLASPCESTNDFYLPESVRSFQTETVNTANDVSFITSMFSLDSEKKLEYCLKGDDDTEVAQPTTIPIQEVENLHGGRKLLQTSEERDDFRASKDSRSYSQRCHSTVTEFLLLVEQNLENSADGFGISSRRYLKRSSNEVSFTNLQDPGTPQLTALVDESDFSDKAVDGNFVATRHTPQHRGSNLSSDIFYTPSVVWDVASAGDSPKRTSFVNLSEPVFNCLTMDRYLTDFSNHYSSFITPKVNRTNHPLSRSCEAIGKSKPTRPSRSRRISFDQLRYDNDAHLTPPGDKGPSLGKRNLCDRQLHTSPVTPDDQCLNASSHASSSATLCNLDRSSALSVSKKYFLQSPSSRVQGKCGRDTESITSSKSLQLGKDSAAEVDQGGSGKRARALFSNQESSTLRVGDDCLKSYSPHYSSFEVNYEDMIERRNIQDSWRPENLSGHLLLAQESNSNFRKSSGSAWDCGLISDCGITTDDGLRCLESRGPSLHDLCKVWDEDCMDLVTRSLKYKSLITDPNLLRHEVKLAFEKPEPTSSESAAWEIENIERLLEKLKTRESLKELIKQQRDTIYINIATNASMRDRYRLYSKWGIRRLSRGRLRKVIYDLLWKDPKRYHASADLVLQYL